ncbi:hypothetical protein [Pseudomonas putida]|uniref:Uncharacterized protein n=1 Tax=Pseudomonas putida TaxID=303 RepID=A0A7V8J580_PSEPU|nr:hypothetical protein [Pseudomonas putida]KAF0255738.1 hypothetical protein GN299_06515 [Pseudomonas putida]
MAFLKFALLLIGFALLMKVIIWVSRRSQPKPSKIEEDWENDPIKLH